MLNNLKKFSKKLNVQLLAEVFKSFGIEHIVLSPGSRNGALATHFSHHSHFKTYSIVDERSAGFVALGMAQQLRKPVVLCCTSGSALANYYPAVTEAFYQNIPLIVLSADRPPHLIDNFDGQTIRQENFLEKHSYYNIQLLEDESTASLADNLGLIKKAVISSFENSGPVHINMPFEEPLYEFQDSIDIHFEEFKIPKTEKLELEFEELITRWNSAQKKMVLVGMHFPDEKLNEWMKKLSDDDSVVVFTETTSNLHSPRFFNKIDSVIFSLNEEVLENLKPDILLTIGQNVVSKKIKNFIRKHKPTQHWHVDTHWQPDTFQCLTEKIQCGALEFLEEFVPHIYQNPSHYFNDWNSIRKEKEIQQKLFAENQGYSDFKVFEKLIETYPPNSQIQYSNSSVIRYAQLFNHSKSQEIFCNRGTSGIDGCTSTAAGASIITEKQVILVTGDISFFYDSNGLWNSYIPSTFRIILINNGGGNIFKIIPGPDKSGVVEEVFETRHHLSAKPLAELYGFEFEEIKNLEELKESLKEFYIVSERPKIMEINTSHINNAKIQRDYFIESQSNS